MKKNILNQLKLIRLNLKKHKCKTSSNLVEISENHLVRHNTKVLSTMIYDIALELISTIPFVPSDKRK